MFTLRQITPQGQRSDMILGKEYSVLYQESEDFKRWLRNQSPFPQEDKCYGAVIYNDGEKQLDWPLYHGHHYYIMNDKGGTYEKLQFVNPPSEVDAVKEPSEPSFTIKGKEHLKILDWAIDERIQKVTLTLEDKSIIKDEKALEHYKSELEILKEWYKKIPFDCDGNPKTEETIKAVLEG